MRSIVKKVIGFILISTLIIGSTAGCGSKTTGSEADVENSSADSAENTELKTVRIGGISQGDYLSGFVGVAQQLGFLEEAFNAAGYAVEVSGFQSGPAVNEAFASSGGIDIAVVGDLPAITAKGGGLDTRMIATIGGNIKYSILAHDDFEFTGFKDFEGKKIAVSTGTILEYFVESLLTDNGVDLSKVEFVNDASPQTFISGEVDFFPSVTYVNDTYEKEGYGKVIYTTFDEPQYNSIAIGYTSDKFINENPDAIKAIISALERTVDYVKENSEEYYQLLSDATSGTFKAESFAIENDDPTFENYKPNITEEDVEWLKGLKNFALDNGLITGDFDVDSWIYYVE